MNSRERLLAAISCQQPDHTPLINWCFGLQPPANLRWRRNGREVPFWYTMRLEHIHTLPVPWDVDDDFERVQRWLNLGVDDVLDVSVPWSMGPEVTVRDWQEPPTAGEPYTVLCREYDTPAGKLVHKVRQTGEQAAPGWVVQPNTVRLIEDYNIPRAVKHAVAGPQDLAPLRYLLRGPSDEQIHAFRERMAVVKRFAQEKGVLVQGWSAFGMDGVIWLTGVEAAVVAAVTEPDYFQELLEIVHAWDKRRTEILLDVGGADMVVQRGWYSSTDFWSPALFRRLLVPHLQELAGMAHQAGRKFAYTMTTGTMAMSQNLLDSGIDLLYYIDPVADKTDLATVKQRFAGKMALAGGVSSGVTLAGGVREDIRRQVLQSMRTLGEGGGFILAPVDALFPDTPWCGVETMIEAWREAQG